MQSRASSSSRSIFPARSTTNSFSKASSFLAWYASYRSHRKYPDGIDDPLLWYFDRSIDRSYVRTYLRTYRKYCGPIKRFSSKCFIISLWERNGRRRNKKKKMKKENVIYSIRKYELTHGFKSLLGCKNFDLTCLIIIHCNMLTVDCRVLFILIYLYFNIWRYYQTSIIIIWSILINDIGFKYDIN